MAVRVWDACECEMCVCVQDVGGQDKIRPLWRHYYLGTQALIFVVDAHDVERIDEARAELHRILDEKDMRNVVVLVFANKQVFGYILGALYAPPPSDST